MAEVNSPERARERAEARSINPVEAIWVTFWVCRPMKECTISAETLETTLMSTEEPQPGPAVVRLQAQPSLGHRAILSDVPLALAPTVVLLLQAA